MRFSFAHPALLAKSLVDASDDGRPRLRESRRLVARNRNLGHAEGAPHERSFQTLLSREARSKHRAELKLRTTKASAGGSTSNANAHNVLECNPSSSADSKHPDVGVLGCGDHHYCIESDVSSLGGVCIPESFRHRHAQENFTNTTYGDEHDELTCDNNIYPFLDEECTCESNKVLGTHAHSCTTGLCMQVPALCNQRASVQFCGQDEIEYAFGTTSAHLKRCLNLTSPNNETGFHYCLGYTYNFTEVVDGDCELEVGGTKCNSCRIHPDWFDFYALNEISYAIEFNCENTSLNASGRVDARSCRFAFEGGYSYLNVMLFSNEDKNQTKCFKNMAQAMLEEYMAEAFPCDSGGKRPRSSIRGGF